MYDPYLNPVVTEMQEIADLLRGLHEETVKLKKTVASIVAGAVLCLAIYHHRRTP